VTTISSSPFADVADACADCWATAGWTAPKAIMLAVTDKPSTSLDCIVPSPYSTEGLFAPDIVF
jgi:hypothetical protein